MGIYWNKSASWVSGGLALVFFITLAAYQLHLNFAATGFLELVVVLVVAVHSGFWQATATSIVANCCLNYFFVPPLFNFVIAQRENWVALSVFEFSALLVSRLSMKQRQHADCAMRRERELQILYDVAHQLLLIDRKVVRAADIARLLFQKLPVESLALFDASESECQIAGEGECLKAVTRGAYQEDRDFLDLGDGTRTFVLRLGVRPIGALTVAGTALSNVTLHALASLTAIALERSQSFVRESQSEAERQVEKLRTAVLDSLAHDFKTPLTVIRTATTGLMEVSALDAGQMELLVLIDDQSTLLSELTSRLLKTSRLDKADVRLRRESIKVLELVEGALIRSQIALSGRKIEIQGLDHPSMVRADRELMMTALAHYLENADKYSQPGSPITISVTERAAEIQIGVHNHGTLIPTEEKTRVFQRFYRSASSSHKASGTGIGLSITKKIADAHQGRVWVTSEEGSGTTFFLALPHVSK